MLLKAFKVEVQFWSLLASPHPKSHRQSSHRVHIPWMPIGHPQMETEDLDLQSTTWRSFFLCGGKGKGLLKGISEPWGPRKFDLPGGAKFCWSKWASLHAGAPLQGVFKALHQPSSPALLTPALFSFIISGVQIKPQEEGERSFPVGKLIRIWEIMVQIIAFFGDLPCNLRQNTLDYIQALHHSDYGRLR